MSTTTDHLSPKHNETRAMNVRVPTIPGKRHAEVLGADVAQIWDHGTKLIGERNALFTEHSKALAALEQAEATDTEALAQALVAGKAEPKPTAARNARDKIADLRRRALAVDRAAYLSRQRFRDGLEALTPEHRTTVCATLEAEAAQAATDARQLYAQAEDAKRRSAELRTVSLWLDVCPDYPAQIRRADAQRMAMGRTAWLEDLDAIATPTPTCLDQDDDE